MKLTIDRSAFIKALSHSQGVIEKRTTLPILSHILLVATPGNLQITATDLEFSLVESIAAHVQEPGKATSSAHMLYDIVRKLPDGSEIDLIFDPKNNRLEIRCGAANFRLPSLSIDEFPTVNAESLPYQFSLPASDFRLMIEKARFAMSTDETRYFLNGIYLHTLPDEKVLCAAATDGHRLAQIKVDLPSGADNIPGVILSRKTVTELARLISDLDQDLQIGLSKTQISVRAGGALVISRLIDAHYPDYRAAIPVDNEKVMRVKVGILKEAIDRVSTVLSARAPGIRLRLDTTHVTLSANSDELGNAEENVAIEYVGNPLEIGFNARYLLDITNVLGDDTIEARYKDPMAPVSFRTADQDRITFVLMPMRV